MQRQKVLMDAVTPTTEVEGYVEVAFISVFAKGNTMHLRLQNGNRYDICLDEKESGQCCYGGIPRIDNNEYVVIHLWNDKVVAIQVIGIGSTLKFAFTIKEPHPHPQPKFVPQ